MNFSIAERAEKIDTEQLVTFERIVREGSFSRAARVLDMAQPTISARIQALEDEIGGPLFIRGGRNVTLTERGESFLPYARRALSILVEGTEVAQLTQKGERGRVSIGALYSLAGGFLTRAIARFHRQYPDTEIFVRTGHSDQVETMLYDGIARLGIITWPYHNHELIPLLYFREPLIFVVPPAHPLTKQAIICAEDIHTQARPLLIIQWGISMGTILTKIMPHQERTMVVPVETARKLLLQDIGAAFVTRTLVEEDLAQKRLIELKVQDIPTMYHETALTHLSHQKTLSAAIHNFIAILRQTTDVEISEHPW